MKNSLYIVLIFAIAVMVAILGFFLMDIERITLFYIAFGFLLLSFAVTLLASLTLSKWKNDKDSMFYNASLGTITVIYQIAAIISVFFTGKFLGETDKFIFLEIVINALYFIVVISIITFSKHVYDNNIETNQRLKNGEYNKPKRGGF